MIDHTCIYCKSIIESSGWAVYWAFCNTCVKCFDEGYETGNNQHIEKVEKIANILCK